MGGRTIRPDHFHEQIEHLRLTAHTGTRGVWSMDFYAVQMKTSVYIHIHVGLNSECVYVYLTRLQKDIWPKGVNGKLME